MADSFWWASDGVRMMQMTTDASNHPPVHREVLSSKTRARQILFHEAYRKPFQSADVSLALAEFCLRFE
jgi:hypothetical protein